VTHDALHAAALTWNDPTLTLDTANLAIHDGVPLEHLMARAQGYIDEIFGRFPYIDVPSGATCLEIGSGVGWIMEALDRKLCSIDRPAGSITGLDIAENMMAKARLRLGDREPFRLLHYDGVHVPLADASVDFIYSVAALQHVPKPYVYNLFFEIKRLLKPGGYCIVHLLPWSVLAEQEKQFPWSSEIRQQMDRTQGHWHHFYCAEELNAVLKIGTKFEHVDIQLGGGWTCVANHAPALS
jgi:ubiquinone/menaquinone biosynthesis C-methylase UbiE